MTNRHLSWAGCRNVRDLGGLPTADGGRIRPGALVRADALERLTADGWTALWEHGIRTVIDLRNDDEIGEDDAPRPAGLTTVRLPLDGMEDTEFWEQWIHRPEFGTPHYYGPWLERFPERAARVLAAIAHAAPGGVAIHCGIGRDRTGLVTMLALAFAGVPPDVIAADYALSVERVPVLLERLGAAEQVAELDAFYAERATTPAEVFAGVLDGFDAEAYLRAAGLGVGDLAGLHLRLVESVRTLG
jgi:protein tyrosine/serine phosphatase